MFEIIKAGGWVMAPLILCSIIVAAIIAERLWTLQAKRVAPEHLAAQVWHWIRNGEFDEERMQALRTGTPLGRLLAIALLHRNSPRDVLNDAIADAGRHIVHELDRYLITLGTIATISPLLGLLGTVLGIMRVFAAISQALITTVVGLGVAIPAYAAHRYLRGRVDDLVVSMERETMRLMNALQGKQTPAEWQRRGDREAA